MISTNRKTRITTLLLFTMIFILFNVINANSQTAANHWVFGDFGIVFNDEEVVVNHDFAMFEDKGTSSYTNENGDLLFYTNGLHIWNNINKKKIKYLSLGNKVKKNNKWKKDCDR